MSELKNSKYCMFTIMSFVDLSHIVNAEILSNLNQKFRNWSQHKS